jgi:hypothetical protein
MTKKILFTIAICTITIVVFIICLWFYLGYLRKKEYLELEKQGLELAQKVEKYKKIHHKIPDYLEDMGLNLPDNYPLYYNTTKDSGVYVISFQVRAFKSMVYYSDTKEWRMQH